MYYFEARKEEEGFCDSEIRPGIRFVSLGTRSNILKRTYLNRQSSKKIANDDQVNFLILRMPTPLFFYYSTLKKKTVVPYVVGNYREAIENTSGLKRLLFNILNRQFIKNWNAVSPDNLVFCNSLLEKKRLEKEGRSPILIKSSTLSEKSFPNKKEGSSSNSPRFLLFSGRITREKGIHNVVQVVETMNDQGFDISFRIAGFTMGGDSEYEEDLKRMIQTSRFRDKFEYLGFLKAGDELNRVYQDSDIFVLPSISDFEGFPRAIWEAMAFGMPVIASRVGSIPFFLEDQKSCLLLQPNSKDEIETAIKRLIEDAELRSRLIHEGYNLARENTIEKSAKLMVDIIQEKANVE